MFGGRGVWRRFEIGLGGGATVNGCGGEEVGEAGGDVRFGGAGCGGGAGRGVG